DLTSLNKTLNFHLFLFSFHEALLLLLLATRRADRLSPVLAASCSDFGTAIAPGLLQLFYPRYLPLGALAGLVAFWPLNFARILTVRSNSSLTSKTFSLRSLSKSPVRRNSLTWSRASSDCWPPIKAPSQPRTKNILRSRLTWGSAASACRR